MKILIGSKNPVKINGAKRAFERYYKDCEVIGVAVSSEVPEQPFNDDILLGARNRVKNLKQYALENNIEADFFVSIEAGITDKFGFWLNINFAVVADNKGYESIGTSEGFPIPKKHIEEIKKADLGAVMDKISNIENVKQKFGGVYVLTREITREDLTAHAFIMALTQFVNGEVWKD